MGRASDRGWDGAVWRFGPPSSGEATFQNWQSEFLAVGSFAVLTIFLCQRGSLKSDLDSVAAAVGDSLRDPL